MLMNFCLNLPQEWHGMVPFLGLHYKLGCTFFAIIAVHYFVLFTVTTGRTDKAVTRTAA
jgi:hypothetical protein